MRSQFTTTTFHIEIMKEGALLDYDIPVNAIYKEIATLHMRKYMMAIVRTYRDAIIGRNVTFSSSGNLYRVGEIINRLDALNFRGQITFTNLGIPIEVSTAFLDQSLTVVAHKVLIAILRIGKKYQIVGVGFLTIDLIAIVIGS